jgi:aminopeptidase N
LIESFNIKVGKGYVLMRSLKDLVGTEDFLHRLELSFHQFLHKKIVEDKYPSLKIG